MEKTIRLLPAWVLANMRIIKFLSIGGSLYLLSALLLFLFKEKMKIEAAQAYLYVTLFTYTLQFVLNAVFTWSDRTVSKTDNVLRVLKFVPAKLVVWTINQGIYSLWLMLGIHYQIANAFTVLMVMAINYVVFDRLIFTK